MNPQIPIYLDYAATTPVDERVLAVMQAYWNDAFGNPSSIHQNGQRAEAALDQSRRDIAACLHALPEEVIFTSGGTESDNLALRGTAFARRAATGADTLVISPVEHPAVSQTARQLAGHFGFRLVILPVDSCGLVNPQDVARVVDEKTALVSIIYANNEIGSINPIREIGAICRERGIPFHSDAVQAAAHLPLDFSNDLVDLLSLGAHKFYGPKGVGALLARTGTPLWNMQTGGGQEAGRRAGTENIPYITGMASALKIVCNEGPQRGQQLTALRDHLIAGVLNSIPCSRLTGHPSARLPNHASFALQGVNGNVLLMALDQHGFACSSGSACKVGSPRPSEVLLALGLEPEWALGSLRVTLGKNTTRQEIDLFLGVLPDLVARIRAMGA